MNAAGKDEARQVFLGLGSNIQPEENLPEAMSRLRQAMDVEAVSSVWKTPPVGGEGPDFLNAAVQARTALPIEELRGKVLRPIEEGLGRIRTTDPNAPRTIDIDILIYDGNIIEEELWEQAHICVPLAELIPDYRHPARGETLKAAAARLSRTVPLRRTGQAIEYK